MLITDKFIFLLLPKTGTNYVEKVIKKVYGEYYLSLFEKIAIRLGFKKTQVPRRTSLYRKLMLRLQKKQEKVKQLLLKNIRVDYRKNFVSKHTVYDQIPEEYRDSDREIVSIMRNPYSAYVSRYTYKTWIRRAKKEGGKKLMPNFPNLSFAEFLEYSQKIQTHRLQGITPKVPLGTLSIQYIQFFCKDYKTVLAEIDYDYKKNGLYEKHFPAVTFLRTENINEDLIAFLHKQGFSLDELAFIREEKRENVSNRKSYMEFLDEETIQRITELEWLLFDLFPDYKRDV